MTTWKKLIQEEMDDYEDKWEEIVRINPGIEEITKTFNDGYGTSEGASFTVWTKTRVYFPAVYDGAEWVSSVPRDPCDEIISHVGGQ